MSYLFAPFDPVAVPQGFIKTNGINKNEQIVFYNSSLACVQLTFQDKSVDVLPPSWVRSYEKISPLGSILYLQQFVLPLAGQPVSTCYGVIYENGEHIQEINCPIQYVYAIGNAGGIPVGSATAVQNDGNTSGTSVVEATVLGDGSSGVSLTNNGHLLLGTTANDGFLQITTAAGGKKVIVGTDGTLTVDKGIVANLITAETGNNIGHHVGSGQSVVDTINGVDTFFVGSQGPGLLNGATFNFLTGSISKVSKSGPFTTSAGSHITVSHGLGSVPDFIIISINSTSLTAHNVYWNNPTSTQVDLYSDATIAVYLLCIKF